MKRFLIIVLLSFALCLVSSSSALSATPEVSININGVDISSEIPPLVVAGQTMIPVRTLCEALGCSVVWDQKNRSVVVVKGSQVVIVPAGKGIATKNGVPLKTRMPVLLIEGRALVAVRLIAEAFGATVSWDPTAKKVDIVYSETRDGLSAHGLLDKTLDLFKKNMTYRFEGKLDISSSTKPDVVGNGATKMNIVSSGIYNDPKLYEKDIMSMSDEEESITSETYYDGTNFYQKEGNADWEKLDLGLTSIDLNSQLSQNPQDIITEFESVPVNVAFGDDALINGKSHYTLYVKFDQNKLKDYLMNEVIKIGGESMTPEDIAMVKSTFGSILSSLRFDLTYRAYVEKENSIMDAFQIRSVFKIFSEGLGTSISNIDASYRLSDINKPVELPSIKIPPVRNQDF